MNFDFGIEGIASDSRQEHFAHWWLIMRTTGGKVPVVMVDKCTGEIEDVVKMEDYAGPIEQ